MGIEWLTAWMKALAVRRVTVADLQKEFGGKLESQEPDQLLLRLSDGPVDHAILETADDDDDEAEDGGDRPPPAPAKEAQARSTARLEVEAVRLVLRAKPEIEVSELERAFGPGKTVNEDRPRTTTHLLEFTSVRKLPETRGRLRMQVRYRPAEENRRVVTLIHLFLDEE